MVKVAGYILGEFGNLIAGDQRSSPLIQFQLLNSKYHLCSTNTRALLLTTYVKFINLFPEIKLDIQAVLNNHSNIRSADAELQQRTVEYLQLSKIASTEVLATVLEEMPPFPERDSSILATLKKKKPGMNVPEKVAREGRNSISNSNSGGLMKDTSMDLLGLASSTTPSAIGASFSMGGPSMGGAATTTTNSSLLVDLFGESTTVGEDSTLSPATNGLNGVNTSGSDVPIVHSNEECLEKLLCKGNGILFENALLQIGVKSEYKTNLGRISLFYGNKTGGKFTNFLPTITCPPGLSEGTFGLTLVNCELRVGLITSCLCSSPPGLSVQAKPVETAIEGGAQVQQLVNVESLDHFSLLPELVVQFTCNNVNHKLKLQLPVTVNKFFEPTNMNSENFFQRWKNLNKYVLLSCF